MFKTTKQFPLASLAIPVTLVLATACSSGSDDAEDDGNGNGNGGVVPEPPPTAVDGLNDTNLRSTSVQALELVDSLEYFLGTATALMLNHDANPIRCAGDGTLSVDGDAPEQRFVFTECDVDDGTFVRLNGTVAFEGANDEGFTGTQNYTTLSATSNARTVSINGQLNLAASPGSTQATEMQLTVDTGTAAAALSDSSFSIIDQGSDSQSVQMALTADIAVSGLLGASIESTDLSGMSAACPQAGTLTVTAADGSSLMVEGAQGTNLMITTGDNMDTLACSEIANIDQTIVPVPLDPPEPPDQP